MLLLIVLPFFMSYVLRTVAWQLILSDNGWVVARLPRRRARSARTGGCWPRGTAVIAGITYNFLPFMALPLYVSLEKIDRRLIEAATDLYASRATAFRKVTLPLALPGIFAGSLLTFIPACGDFINAALLGTPHQYMIGNVIQSKFLNILDYPTRGRAVVHADGVHPDRDLRSTPGCSARGTSPRRRSDGGRHRHRRRARDRDPGGWGWRPGGWSGGRVREREAAAW